MSDDAVRDPVDRALSNIEARLDALSLQISALSQQLGDVRRLVGPFAAAMPDGRMLVQTIHNIKYLIDPRDLIMAPQLIIYRQWEPDLSALLRSKLSPDSVFVDVGANFGYFTCLAGSLIGRSGKGRVIAVEPNPALVDLLRANAVINWSMCPIEILPVAVSDQAGRASLAIPRAGAANASLSTNLSGADVSTVEVELRPLDAIVPPGVAVDLLKIDVEGHETAVLMGARRVFADSPAITVVLEWSQGQMRSAGYPPEQLIDVIDDLGLTAFEAPADGRASGWKPLPAESLLAMAYGNILLRRRDEA